MVKYIDLRDISTYISIPLLHMLLLFFRHHAPYKYALKGYIDPEEFNFLSLVHMANKSRTTLVIFNESCHRGRVL